MSQPAVAALAPLPFELVFDDGIPLETYWHRQQMNLLIDAIHQIMAERGRRDYFVGGNNFVYYSYEQAWEVVSGRPYFRGPDVFYVGGVDGSRPRQGWVAWEEGGRLPDFIVEILSPSTAKIDRTVKKDLYARTFRTAEYFLYDPDKTALEGFRLAGDSYRPILPNAQGRLPSEELGLELGLWEGTWLQTSGTWARFYHADGRLAPTINEAAQAQAASAQAQAWSAQIEAQRERSRADTAEARAAAAEAELERLRAQLDSRNGQS